MSMEDIFGKVIDAYTRADAIADGSLIDVSETAKEAGIKFPVAVTSAVWHGIIVPDPRAKKYGQDEQGRLWDCLTMFRYYAARSNRSAIQFQFYAIMKEKQRRLLTLKAVIGPGDTMEPVITIMELNES